ncbi:MAG: hypothetical protein IK092_07640 [Muribaculaceae bacterium]|nr:hypothetical protein [Muribaculaceae bacterium]
MKRIAATIMVLCACLQVSAQFTLPQVEVPTMPRVSTVPEDSVFIYTNPNPLFGNTAFAECFEQCDFNHDYAVSLDEAAQTTELYLSYGGRKNIIGNYDFLKHFPNLIRLDVGNTALEEIDLTCCPQLEELCLTFASRIKRIKLAKGCCPHIFYPDIEGDITITIVAPEQLKNNN